MFAFTSSTVVAALIVSSFAIPMPDAGAKSFTLQNGKDAVALNDKFASLNANSQCTDGEDACINGQFAQCTGGKFALTTCGAGTVCAALPLVNKAGTAVTCTTTTDRDTRIAATGAAKRETKRAASFVLQNGKDAQAKNAKAATLTPDSPCTDGENTCINDQFAQCANGKFVLTPCGGGLKCVTLPLVNSKGTSTTCDTEADAIQRIKNTGAGSTIDGN